MTITNLKFKLAIALTGLAVLSGCATNAQNAALAGVIAGAVIANEMNQPRQVVVVPPPPPRPVTCYNHWIGRDVNGRAVYQQVCR
jgi:hypothetical protein